jgi:hypothetical protein
MKAIGASSGCGLVKLAHIFVFLIPILHMPWHVGGCFRKGEALGPDESRPKIRSAVYVHGMSASADVT